MTSKHQTGYFLCNRFKFAGIFILKLKIYTVFRDIVHLQLHILLSRTAQISLELHFCVELHTKKALPASKFQVDSRSYRLRMSGYVRVHTRKCPTSTLPPVQVPGGLAVRHAVGSTVRLSIVSSAVSGRIKSYASRCSPGVATCRHQVTPRLL